MDENSLRRLVVGIALSFTAAIVPSGAAAPASPQPKPAPPARTQPRCQTPQGEPIPAQKIMKDLADGREVQLTGRIIDGNLDADFAGPAADDRRTSLRVFRGRLRLDSCRIRGRVAFTQAVLGELGLTCSEIQGDVELRDAQIRGGLSAENSRIMGAIKLDRVQVERDVMLRGALLEDGVEIGGSNLRGLNADGAEIRGNFELARTVVSLIDITNAKIASQVRLDEVLVMGDLAATGSSIEKGLAVEGLRSLGSVYLNGVVSPAGLSLSGLNLDGSLYMSVWLEGALSLTDASVRENLMMIDGQFGEVAIARLTVGQTSDLTGAVFRAKTVVTDTNFGTAFRTSETLFSGNAEFRKVRFAGQDPMGGALFERAPLLVDTPLPNPPRVRTTGEEEDAGDEEIPEDPDEP